MFLGKPEMKSYLMILPIALLVTYSQLVVTLRSNAIDQLPSLGLLQQIIKFISDPVVLSAYAAALFASFAWLYVVTKIPLIVAFPVYIGVTFAMVLLGGWYFLSESLTLAKIIAVMLIFGGIALGVMSDA
jgi:multidrug transporter EmrE-like cation transporter